MLGATDNRSLEEEMETCRHFFVDSEMENGRHKLSSFAMNFLDAPTLSHKLDAVFEKLKCVAKLNVAFGFVLNNIDDGNRRYY